MEREIGFRREAAVNRDQIADPGNLRREHDPVVRLAELLGERRGADRALEHRFESDLLRLERLGAARVRIHQLGQKLPVERAPVHPDPDRLRVLHRHLDDAPEVRVTPRPGPDVPGVDPVFVEGTRALGVVVEQDVSAEVKISDDRRADSRIAHAADDLGHRFCGFGCVDGDADQLRSRVGELDRLVGGRLGIGGIGVRHRLNRDRATAPDRHGADRDGRRAARARGRGLGRRMRGVRHRPLSLPAACAAVKSGVSCFS